MKFRDSCATLMIVLILSSLLAGCSGSSNSSEKELEGGWLVYDDLLENDSEDQYFYRYLLFESDGFVGTASWDSKDSCQEKYGDDGIWLESEGLCFPPDRRWDSWKVLDEMRMTWTSTNDIPLNENDCMEEGSFDGFDYTTTAYWQNESQTCIEIHVSEIIYFLDGDVLIYTPGDIDYVGWTCEELFVEGVKVGFRDLTDGPEQGDLMQRIEAAIEDPC
ncbi:hypothetical protein OAK49_03205 [Euryarchaeota archaeon]|nr:hypothetical protein [Euryarchaeota archaeon]